MTAGWSIDVDALARQATAEATRRRLFALIARDGPGRVIRCSACGLATWIPNVAFDVRGRRCSGGALEVQARRWHRLCGGVVE